jgi:hypothetical protein
VNIFYFKKITQKRKHILRVAAISCVYDVRDNNDGILEIASAYPFHYILAKRHFERDVFTNSK